MEVVKLYIKTSLKGPRRQQGASIYLMETNVNGLTATVDGTVIQEETTEARATLKALDAGLGRLKRPVSLWIWLDCANIGAALTYDWPEKWEKDGWTTTKGKPVANMEEWQHVLEKMRIHEIHVMGREHHPYARWMEEELKKVKVAPVQRQKGEEDV